MALSNYSYLLQKIYIIQFIYILYTAYYIKYRLFEHNYMVLDITI